MPRPLPPEPPSPAILERKREPLLSVEIQVVTPLFGGGAIPREVDRELPVRGSSVRGQLRFWWRACHATRYRTAEELFRAEAGIWGTAAVADAPAHRGGGRQGKTGPAAIEVDVEILDPGRPVLCQTREPSPSGRGDRFRWRNGYPGYALFPFQAEAGGRGAVPAPPAQALEGVRFRLTLARAPHVGAERRVELLAAAEDALWAWVTFGGIGARTRRGCGSLFCADERFAPSGQVGVWLREMAARHITAGERRLPVPVLSRARLLSSGEAEPLRAWKEAIDRLQEFRQARDQGGSDRPSRAGRTHWPEPGAIRQRLRLRDAGQSEPVQYFPRADLGLPIIFQRLAEPSPVLQGNAPMATRMASPLILKPLAVSARAAVPLVLLLNAPHVWDQGAPPVVVVQGSRPVGPLLQTSELQDLEKDRGIQPLNGSGARDAFMAHVARRWRVPEVRL